jgi:hypothetical protein
MQILAGKGHPGCPSETRTRDFDLPDRELALLLILNPADTVAPCAVVSAVLARSAVWTEIAFSGRKSPHLISLAVGRPKSSPIARVRLKLVNVNGLPPPDLFQKYDAFGRNGRPLSTMACSDWKIDT